MLIKRGRERVREFSWERSAERLVTLFSDVHETDERDGEAPVARRPRAPVCQPLHGAGCRERERPRGARLIPPRPPRLRFQRARVLPVAAGLLGRPSLHPGRPRAGARRGRCIAHSAFLRISLIVNTPIGHRERSGATLDGSVFPERSLSSRRPL
jgi:hypothetical protein